MPLSSLMAFIRFVIGGLISFWVLSANAYPAFVATEEVRSVSLYGKINLLNLETQDFSTTDFNKEVFADPNVPVLTKVGMDLQPHDSGVSAQGVATQSFKETVSGFSFEGLADVNVSGYSAPPVQAEGEGFALVKFRYGFSVQQGQEIQLDMNSQAGTSLDENFTFTFKNDMGEYVWAGIGTVGDDGIPTRAFSKRFYLPSGNYTIDAQISAKSRLWGNSSTSGRTWATFAVSAVPEPGTLPLALMGAALFIPAALLKRRVRQAA